MSTDILPAVFDAGRSEVGVGSSLDAWTFVDGSATVLDILSVVGTLKSGVSTGGETKRGEFVGNAFDSCGEVTDGAASDTGTSIASLLAGDSVKGVWVSTEGAGVGAFDSCGKVTDGAASDTGTSVTSLLAGGSVKGVWVPTVGAGVGAFEGITVTLGAIFLARSCNPSQPSGKNS